jgi:uncharacterized protein
MITTKLSLEDTLPLTCSRTGTCCHGKQVLLNPWELLCIAKEKNISPREFQDLYCDLGGIRLRFDGNKDALGQSACSQYIENFGCAVHLGRPLACRLYPLGRQIQNEEVQYIFEGKAFPCLNGCPEVTGLPHLSVGEYLEGQVSKKFENAQDEYLEVMQNLADVAFALLLDTGLSESGDKKTIPQWRIMGEELPEILADRIGKEWRDCIMFPQISENTEDPILFARKHNELLQLKTQNDFETLLTNEELHEASVLIMGVALYLARAIGANPTSLTEHWVEIAKSYGALG